MTMADGISLREDNPYELEAATVPAIDELHTDEAEQQASQHVYSQVMKKKQNPSGTAVDSVRQKVVYAKPAKGVFKISTINEKPGKTYFHTICLSD